MGTTLKGTGIFILSLLILKGLVNGDCENLPEVANSSNNSTGAGSYIDGSALEFSCNEGYNGIGNMLFHCRGTEWSGSYTCLRSCGFVEAPDNGGIVGNPAYVVNTRVKFTCSDGYILNGASSMLCRADGNWRPDTPPTCTPVNCGEFGRVNNGEVFQKNLDGILNDFKSRIEVTCNEGFILLGSSIVTCEASGAWSLRPQCESSSCGSHPGSESQCVMDSSLSDDGTLLSLLCEDPSTNVSVSVVGSGNAICSNNQWDDLNMGCFCDCMVNTESKGIMFEDLINSKFVKHGRKLNWKCDEGYVEKGSSNITCNDGKMGQPLCVKKINGDKGSTKWYVAVIIAVIIGIIITIGVTVLIVLVLIKTNVIKIGSKKDEGTGPESLPLDDKAYGNSSPSKEDG